MLKITVELRNGDSFVNYVSSINDVRNSEGVFSFEATDGSIVGIPMDYIKYFTLKEKGNEDN